MAEPLFARQRQIVGSHHDWLANDLVLGAGELALERQGNGTVRARVGDGVTPFSGSPYLDIGSAGIIYRGEADPTIPPPAGAVPGDAYSANPAGVIDAAWGDPPAGEAIALGDLLVLDALGVWNIMPGAIDLAGTVTEIELAGPLGAGMVGFIQAGADAVPRTAESKMRDDVNARDFGVVGDGIIDDSASLQAWLDVLPGRRGWLPTPTAHYRVTTMLNAPANCAIIGENRNATILKYDGATTIPGGAILDFAAAEHVRVENVGVRWGALVVANASVGLRFRNPVYAVLDGFTHGGNAADGQNATKGVLFEETTPGMVPPRGNIVIRNVLCVTEGGKSGAAGSVSIHVKGHPSGGIINVVCEGEGDLEHAEHGFRFDHVVAGEIGPGWQLRGASDFAGLAQAREIGLYSCSNVRIRGPLILPTPTNGVGVYIDPACFFCTLDGVDFNTSSGAPYANIVDQGNATEINGPGAGEVGKRYGRYEHRKSDGTGAHLSLIRSPTDSVSVLELRRATQAMGGPAWLGINIGGMTDQDIERIEDGATLYERVARWGSRFMRCQPWAAGYGPELAPNQFGVFLNEPGNQLIVLVKYADGTVKTSTLPLV